MKRELLLIAGTLYWLLLVGFIAPALISARNTEAVMAGALLVLVSAYVTYRVIRKAFKPKADTTIAQPTPEKENHP